MDKKCQIVLGGIARVTRSSAKSLYYNLILPNAKKWRFDIYADYEKYDHSTWSLPAQSAMEELDYIKARYTETSIDDAYKFPGYFSQPNFIKHRCEDMNQWLKENGPKTSKERIKKINEKLKEARGDDAFQLEYGHVHRPHALAKRYARTIASEGYDMTVCIRFDAHILSKVHLDESRLYLFDGRGTYEHFYEAGAKCEQADLDYGIIATPELAKEFYDYKTPRRKVEDYAKLQASTAFTPCRNKQVRGSDIAFKNRAPLIQYWYERGVTVHLIPSILDRKLGWLEPHPKEWPPKKQREYPYPDSL